MLDEPALRLVVGTRMSNLPRLLRLAKASLRALCRQAKLEDLPIMTQHISAVMKGGCARRLAADLGADLFGGCLGDPALEQDKPGAKGDRRGGRIGCRVLGEGPDSPIEHRLRRADGNLKQARWSNVMLRLLDSVEFGLRSRG
jgi:hypothetical protein